MKKILQYLDWLLFSIVTLFVIYILAALLFSYIKTDPDPVNCQQKKEIYVATNGIHLYLILPRKNLRNDLLQELGVGEDISFISFGWGDKEFYTSTPEWSDLTFMTAFNALFTKSPTALHVTYYRSRSRSWNVVEICDKQLQKLNSYIQNYFVIEEGNFIEINNVKGYSSNDHFFKAKGNYTFYRTSNVWVNQALQEINEPTAVWSPFDFGVLWHLKKDEN